MKRGPTLSLETWVGIYLLLYLPNVMITRFITTNPHPELGRPLTGLETLPASLIISTVLTYLFIWLSGWHRDANSFQLGDSRIPIPTRFTPPGATWTVSCRPSAKNASSSEPHARPEPRPSR